MKEKGYCAKCGIATYYGEYCFDCFDALKHDFNNQRELYQIDVVPIKEFTDDKDE